MFPVCTGGGLGLSCASSHLRESWKDDTVTSFSPSEWFELLVQKHPNHPGRNPVYTLGPWIGAGRMRRSFFLECSESTLGCGDKQSSSFVGSSCATPNCVASRNWRQENDSSPLPLSERNTLIDHSYVPFPLILHTRYDSTKTKTRNELSLLLVERSSRRFVFKELVYPPSKTLSLLESQNPVPPPKGRRARSFGLGAWWSQCLFCGMQSRCHSGCWWCWDLGPCWISLLALSLSLSISFLLSTAGRAATTSL